MKAIKFLIKNYYWICIIAIFLISVLLRFYNYDNRWGLAYDQAQFALISRHAIDTMQIPLLGPFSSGGPFQTGGEWYWIIMMGTILYPFSLISPWVFLTFLTALSVILMIFLGEILVDKKFGLIVGILMALSTSQIAQSTNLTNQTPIIIFSILAVFAAILYLKKNKLRYLFIQAIAIGIASSLHIQAVALLPSLLFVFLFKYKSWKKSIGLIILGLFIPWIPVLIADSQNNFANTINMLTYFSNNQAKASYEVLGRRWLTFLGYFFPLAWARITGGSIFISYAIIISLSVIIFGKFIKKTISKEWMLIILSAISMVVIIRYIRTPLFDSFFIFIHPFIFLLTGLVIYSIFNYKRILGIIVLVIILSGSLLLNVEDISGASNYTAKQVTVWRNQIIKKFPNEKFAVYDFNNGTGGKSLSLALFLNEKGKINDDGFKIGVVIATSGAKFKYPIIQGEKTGYQILSLQKTKISDLEKEGWVFVNPSAIYQSTQYWFKDKKI